MGKAIWSTVRFYAVVGVLPRGFHYPGETDLWRMPVKVGEKFLNGPHVEQRNHAMDVMGRRSQESHLIARRRRNDLF